MVEVNILDAVDRLEFVLDKIDDFNELDLDLSERVLENRIITLEGYLRFLQSEGIPKIRRIYDSLEGGDSNDGSDIL